MECPSVDAGARARLHRLLELYGAEHVTLVIRTIAESDGNENALVEPVIGAVSMVIGSNPAWPARSLQWLEAFDQIPLTSMLTAMREIDHFPCRSLAHLFGLALRDRLGAIFAEMDVPPAVPPVVRISRAKIAIEQGLELLKYKGPYFNSPITKLGSDLFWA